MATPAETNGGDIQVYEPRHPAAAAALQLDIDQRMAKLFVASGLFNDIKSASPTQAIAQAYVKIALGRSMGFSEAEAMQGIDLIQGRPAIGAQLRAARMQRAGFDWDITRLDNEGCVLEVYRGSDPKTRRRLGTVAFLQEDAQKMGLLGKDNWKKQPQDMFFARAITRAQRRFAPGALNADILSREEAIDMGPLTIANGSQPKPDVVPGKGTEDLKRRLTQQSAEIAEEIGEPETVQASDEAFEPDAVEDATQIPPHQQRIAGYREVIGDIAFSRILGSNGCETLADVSNDKVSKIIRAEMESELQFQREEREEKA